MAAIQHGSARIVTGKRKFGDTIKQLLLLGTDTVLGDFGPTNSIIVMDDDSDASPQSLEKPLTP